MYKTKINQMKNKIGVTEMNNTILWNPTTGCDKVSIGCRNCYAINKSYDYQKQGDPKYKNGFNITIHETSLNEPYEYTKSSIVLVSNYSDLFHYDISTDFIKRAFKVMNDNPQHTFKVLTKRANRLVEIENLLSWSANIHIGVTVENEGSKSRINKLRATSAKFKYIVFEPLMGPIKKPNLEGINYVYIGGETGKPNSRAVQIPWVLEIIERCKSQNVPFKFRGWGSSYETRNRTENFELNTI